MNKRRLDIVGAGKVGKTLARLWNQNGVFEIGSVANHSLESSEEAIAFIGAGTTRQIDNIDVLMISSVDDALTECAAQVAESTMVASESMVFHCSGSISSDVLAPLKARGATIASVHPVKSFADVSLAIKTFPGTFCGLEGDPTAVQVLTEAVGAIGGKVFAIDPSSKAIYHAGSVFSSNYLISTVAAGVDCLVRTGIDRETALEILKPIATEAMENLFRLGPVQALTGPIARGETKVVEVQVQALSEWDFEISSTYAALGILATHLSQQQGRASAESIRHIKEILSNLLRQ
jgi:predicted short-subunit dehydrogenase-like oxidoreductase (DUF2520 family)